MVSKVRLSRYTSTMSWIYSFLKLPYGLLLMFSGTFFLLYLVFLMIYPEFQELHSWVSRLSVTTFGAYLTAIVVDRSFREQQRMEQKKIRNVALEQLRKPLNRHLSLLVSMYAASITERPDNLPESWQDLLDEEFGDAVFHLDFSASSPTTDDHELWMDHAASQLEQFGNEVDQVLAKYGDVMQPHLIQTLQNVGDSQMSQLLIMNYELRGHVSKEEYNSYSRQMAPLVNTDVEDHIKYLNDLLDYYESDQSPDLSPFRGTCLHSDDISPSIGSARLNSEFASETSKRRLSE